MAMSCTRVLSPNAKNTDARSGVGLGSICRWLVAYRSMFLSWASQPLVFAAATSTQIRSPAEGGVSSSDRIHHTGICKERLAPERSLPAEIGTEMTAGFRGEAQAVEYMMKPHSAGRFGKGEETAGSALRPLSAACFTTGRNRLQCGVPSLLT
jgi:hypothetical protein